MKQIYWLASYPKSGNTWMRTFLDNYWHDGDTPSNINDLQSTPVINTRYLLDTVLGVDSGDLSQDEIDALRPVIYRYLASHSEANNRFWKIHDAFQRLPSGESIFPANITGGVVYIIRNPLDVVISYAHHNNSTIDETIALMADEEHGLFMNPFVHLNQLHQRMYSWSSHVRSWVDQTDLAVLVVRYEDMAADSVKTFTDTIRFLGMDINLARIEKAIRFSVFEELKKQEDRHGFKEKTQQSDSFFRKGKVGDWRNRLTQEQVRRIIHDHGDIMNRFGYLSESGDPTI